jgi:hypothetical protein
MSITDVRTSIERLPEDHIQLSHQPVLRGNAKNLGLEMLRKRDGNKNQCPHPEGTQTFEHVDPRQKLCKCGKIHKDHSIENGKIICSVCNSMKDSLKLHPYEKRKEREFSAHTINRRELPPLSHLSQTHALPSFESFISSPSLLQNWGAKQISILTFL